jgi:putative nucleotidyltransferase with HDIG domain
MEKLPTREETLTLLKEYTKNESLLKHAYTVELVMQAAAKKLGEDEEKWGMTGLIHDFDYEVYPNAPDHPLKGSEILKGKEYPSDMVEAILGHATYTNTPRNTPMAKWLFAVDELCGFITACALVRPNFLTDLETKSVKKKLKDKAFARSVNREDIYKGAEELNISLDELINFVISAMRENSSQIGF